MYNLRSSGWNTYNTDSVVCFEKTGGSDTAKLDHLIDTEVKRGLERAYLVAVDAKDRDTMWSAEDSLNELDALASTAGMDRVRP